MNTSSAPVGGASTPCRRFLNYLNSFFPFINFTSEIDGFNINFLDLTIFIFGGHHAFSIYKKDSATDSTIDGTYFCPWPHKTNFYEFLHEPC